MTDSEVPQGNQEGRCQLCNRDYPVWFAPNPLWNKVMRDPIKGDKYQFLCLDCFALEAEKQGIVPTAWVLDVEPERIEHNATDSDTTTDIASLPSNGGGSQDSIDMQIDQITVNLCKRVVLAPHDPNETIAALDEARTSLKVWHNTQLKEAIPEKKEVHQKGLSIHEDNQRVGWNAAIDDMQAKLEASDE